MAVQPLNKTKIIKKKTNKIRRYQSDEFGRVKVSLNRKIYSRFNSNVPVFCGVVEVLEEAERC